MTKIRNSQLNIFLLITAILVLYTNCGGGSQAPEEGNDSDNQTQNSSIKFTNKVLSSDISKVLDLIQLKNGSIAIAASDDSTSKAGNGLYISNDDAQSFSHKTTIDGLQRSSVNRLAEGPDGRLYMTHDSANANFPHGYSVSTNSSLTSFVSHLDQLTDKDLNSIDLNSSGDIFTRGNSLLERSLDDGNSFTTVESSRGDLWVGKFSGRVYATGIINFEPVLLVSNDNGDTFSSRSIADGLQGGNIKKVLEDSKGNIYVISNGTQPVAGLSVSLDGGTSFEYRPLPLTENLQNVIGDISINSSDLICVTHEEGISCSRDTGHTWSFTSISNSFSNDKLLLTDSGKIIKSSSVGGGTLLVSNGILPTGLGTANIPQSLKLSSLPSGTYTRKSTKVSVAVKFSGGVKHVVLAFDSNESSVTLASFSGNNSDSVTSNIDQTSLFTKNNDGSVTEKEKISISANMNNNKVFSSSVTQISNTETTTSQADIATQEAQDKDPSNFRSFRFINSTTLRITQALLLNDSGDDFNFFIFTDYTLSQ